MQKISLKPRGLNSEIIKSEKESRKVHLIGSSLGGYYAVYLAESLDLKAAMVNPAVWAYKIFENDRGENLNPNTNEKYVIDQEWIDSLEEIFVETPDTKKYLVLLQTADETLDYRYAEKYFAGAKTIIDQGGSHSFEDLESKIPIIFSGVFSQIGNLVNLLFDIFFMSCFLCFRKPLL